MHHWRTLLHPSLMHVTAWCRWTPDQSSQNSWNKCRMARPLTLSNFVVLWQKVCQISTFKNFWPPRQKLDQSSLKLHKTCYGPMPAIVPNFIALGQTMYKKRVTKIYSLVNFGTSGEPLGQSSLILEILYSKTNSINLPNFVPFWQPV